MTCNAPKELDTAWAEHTQVTEAQDMPRQRTKRTRGGRAKRHVVVTVGGAQGVFSDLAPTQRSGP
jgi:hypothetical protein